MAAYAQTQAGAASIVTAINFSPLAVDVENDLTRIADRLPIALVEQRDGAKFDVADPAHLRLHLEPYKARILLVTQAGV